MKLSIGIDVSKKKLDISVFNGSRHICSSVSNSISGILALHSHISKEKYSELMITMEATGTYYLKAAKKLYELGYEVSVMNPLIIKRFSEMKMLRAKTDTVDSKTIAEYGFYHEPKLYKPKNKEMELVLHLLKALEDINILKNETVNRVEALKQNPDTSDEVFDIYRSLLKEYGFKIKEIEKRIKELMKDNEIYKRMKTIPGVGDRIASAFVSVFDNFKDFDNAKQAASFIGVNPSPYQSGTSVNGKGSISKKGNGYLRKLLYMGALSASKHNKSCRELYERLLLKGKDKTLALIAVANKLVRQIFAIVKYNRVYCENYQKCC
jgi:transposase